MNKYKLVSGMIDIIEQAESGGATEIVLRELYNENKPFSEWVDYQGRSAISLKDMKNYGKLSYMLIAMSKKNACLQFTSWQKTTEKVPQLGSMVIIQISDNAPLLALWNGKEFVALQYDKGQPEKILTIDKELVSRWQLPLLSTYFVDPDLEEVK